VREVDGHERRKRRRKKKTTTEPPPTTTLDPNYDYNLKLNPHCALFILLQALFWSGSKKKLAILRILKKKF